MDHDTYSDDYIVQVLNGTRTIAVVGASPDWSRPSYGVMQFMQKRGYRNIPVNPKAAGTIILGECVYASLSEIPEAIDMVDIFRKSEAAGQVTDEAIAIGAKYIWMQLGVRNDAAARRAEDAGLHVVMDRCPKIEYGRLSGQIGWMGVNSRVISNSRRRRL